MLTATDPLTIAVVNTAVTRDGVYIGRKFAGNPASPLGNPLPLRKNAGDKARARVVAGYREHLHRAIARVQDGSGSTQDWKICQELDRLVVLAKKGPLELRCWCAPKACHGDVIAEVVSNAVQTGRIFCPDGPATDYGAMAEASQLSGLPPQESEADYSDARASPRYGDCWRCGHAIAIPGLDWQKCGQCGWLSTARPPRAKTLNQEAA